MDNASDATAADCTVAAGWIVAMPDGCAYLWYQHGWKGCTDSGAAMALFEPDPDARRCLIQAGWSARPGEATDFYPLGASERIPA
jgi:hypothetical protein